MICSPIVAKALTLLLPVSSNSAIACQLDQLCIRPGDELFHLVRNRRLYFARSSSSPENSRAEQLAKDIVSQGADAMPTLLSAINSKGLIGLELGAGEFNQVRNHGFFDPKIRTKEFKGEPDIDQMLDLPTEAGYRVTKGDLAAFLLGIITNRLYFRPQIYPGMSSYSTLGSNSKQSKTVIKDWGHAGKSDLQKSYEYDVLHPDSAERQIEGFAARQFYFPGSSINLAVRALKTSYLKCPAKNANVASSLMNELIPIACETIDRAVIDLAHKLEKDQSARNSSPFALLHSLAYLSKRKQYQELTQQLAEIGAKLQPERAVHYRAYKVPQPSGPKNELIMTRLGEL